MSPLPWNCSWLQESSTETFLRVLFIHALLFAAFPLMGQWKISSDTCPADFLLWGETLGSFSGWLQVKLSQTKCLCAVRGGNEGANRHWFSGKGGLGGFCSQKPRLLSADKRNFTGFSLKTCGGLALWWFYTTLTISEKQFTTCPTTCRNSVRTASPDFIFTSEMIWNYPALKRWIFKN